MSLKSLSSQERRQYDQQGFIIIPDVFPAAECEAINDELDRLIAEQARANGQEPHPRMWLMQLGLRSDLTRRIASDERFLTLVADIVQPGIAIYSAKLTPKAPHSDDVCVLHQDDAFYRDNSESAVRMSAWLALHHSCKENGAVHFIPGSHKWGLQQWQHAEGDHKHCVREIIDPDPEIMKTAVCPEIKQGSVVLFSALTWHFSGPNTSDRLRRSFIVSYQDALATAGNGPQWQILRPAPEGACAAR